MHFGLISLWLNERLYRVTSEVIKCCVQYKRGSEQTGVAVTLDLYSGGTRVNLGRLRGFHG